MPRFGIGSLLALTAAFAGYFAVARGAGYAAASVVAVSLALIGWSVASSRRGLWLVLRSTGAVAGTIVFWLAGVDERWIVQECPDCHWECDLGEYRVLGVPVWTEHDESWQAITYALRDLGVPCKHPNLTEWLKHRYWGGQICAYPCINGSYGFATDDRYTPAVEARVKELADADPTLGPRLKERVVRKDDRDYFWGGFMLDQVALGAYDAGTAKEARHFLDESPDWLREKLLSSNDHWTPEYIDELYDAGFSEVIVLWWRDRQPWSKPTDVFGELAVRLPTAQPKRRQAIAEVTRRDLAYGWGKGLRDYGQAFAKLPR